MTMEDVILLNRHLAFADKCNDQDLNHEYKRSVDSNNKLRTSRRELRDEDVTTNLDAQARKIEQRMKGLVEHSNEELQTSVTKFDELMKRLKKTAAAHKQEIASGNTEGAISAAQVQDVEK